MTRATDSALDPFSGLLLRHRGRTRLTQRELAVRVGVSRRVEQDWEAGVNVPTADHLQALIAVLFKEGGLSVGHEAADARTLWAAALGESTSRVRRPLDEEWLSGLLEEGVPGSGLAGTAPQAADARRQDWGDAPDIIGFVGRARELEACHMSLVDENCRLLVVLGMGGIGKTMLAARLAEDVAPAFQSVYWRSLRDAPPATEWLAGVIGFLSDYQLVPPANESERLTALLQLLRDRRSLLVLDNFDTLLESSGYREDSAGYERLLQAVGGGRHQSCLLLTSRESPPDLAKLRSGLVRTVELGGLAPADGQLLLAHTQLAGDSGHWATLVARFGGNGLALKVAQ